MVKSYVWCWTQQKTIHDDPHGYSKTIYPAVCRTHGKRPCSKRRSKKARHRSRHGFWKWLEVGKPVFFLDKKGIDDLTSQTFGIWQQQLAFHPTKKSGLLQTTDDCHRTSRFVFSIRKKNAWFCTLLWQIVGCDMGCRLLTVHGTASQVYEDWAKTERTERSLELPGVGTCGDLGELISGVASWSRRAPMEKYGKRSPKCNKCDCLFQFETAKQLYDLYVFWRHVCLEIMLITIDKGKMGVSSGQSFWSFWLSPCPFSAPSFGIFRYHPHVHVLVGAFNHRFVQKWDVSIPEKSDKPMT